MKKLFCAILVVLFSYSPVFAKETWVRDNFYAANVDLSGTTYYIQRVTSKGGWYIKALDTTDTDQFRITYSYVSGDTEYQTAWTNRASTGGTSAYQVFETAF